MTLRLRPGRGPLAGVVLAALAAAACAGDPGQPSAGGAAQISFALPNGWSLETVGYLVRAPDGTTLAAGSEDVGAPRATLSLSLTLPPGRGDVLEVTATTATGTTCAGSSLPFDVTAGAANAVSLVLACGAPSVQSDVCPQVTVAAPSPAEAMAPAGLVMLAASASDPDPGDVPSFAWSATGGAFSDPTAAATEFVCTRSGNVALVLTVDDHHLPAPCQVTSVLAVTCLPDPSAVCGDGVVEPGEACDPPDGVTCGADCQRLPGL
ncbi:MAG TPA: hypothetical protein VHO06_17985 [Polyangia bacterium]|nr:hypothetical protein [Polyangia bacterium]